MNELESALALGEIARARKAAGLPGLTEMQVARFLRDLAEVRSLPQTWADSVPVRVPARRKPQRTTPRTWLNRQ